MFVPFIFISKVFDPLRRIEKSISFSYLIGNIFFPMKNRSRDYFTVLWKFIKRTKGFFIIQNIDIFISVNISIDDIFLSYQIQSFYQIFSYFGRSSGFFTKGLEREDIEHIDER
jgi:hypothetical protein